MRQFVNCTADIPLFNDSPAHERIKNTPVEAPTNRLPFGCASGRHSTQMKAMSWQMKMEVQNVENAFILLQRNTYTIFTNLPAQIHYATNHDIHLES